MASKRSDKITITDVARRAGVSTATAGRVLGGYGYASQEISDKVQESARALGYRPNLLARGLITGRTKTIGVVAGDIQSPFYASILRGISDIARKEGFGVIVTNSDERLDREIEAVQLLLEKQVDGLIVAPCDLARSQHLHDAVASGCPIVQIDRVVGGLEAASVTVDNRGASRACVGHLLAAGHRRIGMIAELEWSDFVDVEAFSSFVTNGSLGPDKLFPSWQRLYGYLEAHRDAGVAVDFSLVPRVGEYSITAARNKTLDLLQSDQPPTGLFPADGLMSAAVMDAVTTLGLSVPDDLSLACFDDLDWMRFFKPGITAVAQPLNELGEAAARLMLDRLLGQLPATAHVVMQPELIMRGSIGRAF